MRWWKRKREGKPVEGVTQTVAASMGYWFLVVAAGLGAVAIGAAYFGLFVVASTFGSIVFVALTVYAFLRYWPDDEPLATPDRPPVSVEEQPRQVAVPVVGISGAPKTRFLFAIREIARRQDDYKISQKGAERFAKVIRYMLRHHP